MSNIKERLRAWKPDPSVIDARQDCQEAADYIEKQDNYIRELEKLVFQLSDDDPCWYDHNGHCQAHGWFSSKETCPNKRVQNLSLDIEEEN